jgi:hypothetical protein
MQLLNELKAYAGMDWNPTQKAWFERRVRDAKPVRCVRMADAFTEKELAAIAKSGWLPEKKGCYKNASDLVLLGRTTPGLPEMHYVEGLALDPALPVSIEHAWVLVCDRHVSTPGDRRLREVYIDPTAERCLGADVTSWEYVSLIEKDWDGLAEILAEQGYYGDVYRYEYIKTITRK